MKIRFQRPTEFAKQLEREGVQWVNQQPSGKYASRQQWAWSFAYATVLIISYYLLLSSPIGFWSLLYCVMVGAASYVVLGAFCHDGAHGSLHPSRWVNNLSVYLGFAIIGVHGPLWKYRHLKKHHPFPNVEGSDVDADGSSLIRLSPHKDRKFWHKFQVLYAPLLYGVVLTHVTWIEDWTHWQKSAEESPKNFTGLKMIFSFFGAKLIHVVLYLVIPYMVLQPTLWQLFLGYLVATAMTSFLFVLVNVGSHITDVCIFPKPDENGVVNSDWATHQLASSVDWSPENMFLISLTSGANAHAAHHLFPSVAHCHNAGLSQIIYEKARKNNIKCNSLTFISMMAAHFRHLRHLGNH